MVSLSKCTNTFNASVFWCYYGSYYDMPSEPVVIFLCDIWIYDYQMMMIIGLNGDRHLVYAFLTAIVSCQQAYIIKFLHDAAYCDSIVNLWEPIFVDLI